MVVAEIGQGQDALLANVDAIVVDADDGDDADEVEPIAGLVVDGDPVAAVDLVVVIYNTDHHWHRHHHHHQRHSTGCKMS